jgi:hypothetical protein
MLLALPSFAAVKRVLLVVTERDPAAAQAALSTTVDLPGLLSRDERVQLVEEANLTAPVDLVEASRASSQAKSAGDEVEALIGQLDFKGARARCEDSLKAAQGADVRAVREPMLRLLVQLARIKRALKVDDAGETELAQAFAIAPELQAPRGLNTSERKAFDTARVRSAALPRATPVVFDGGRLKGWVWVDGRYRGVTPVTADGLTPGRHYVTFAAPGSRVSSSTELLGSLATVQLTAQVTPEGQTYRGLVAALQGGLRKNEPEAAARELAAWAKADEVVVVAVSSASGVEVLRVAPNGIARRVLSNGASNGALASAITSLFDETLKEVTPAPAAALTPPPAPPLVTDQASTGKNTTLGKVLLGVGIGALVAGTAMIVAGRVTYGNAATIPQNEDSRYQNAVQLSNGLNMGGISTAAAGAVAAGVGAIFTF